ncbi:hypothetical protein NDU88_004263 [Pleurodeles waltl]|uniref:Centrosomal protein CCDC61 n=1 Tax=Pleurodeles waltl TaxID=8319 RepID=A0AAV7N2J1_PLEWA|nr:hypothetical protein NDU88_004263 [Pleurodeles waltl]
MATQQSTQSEYIFRGIEHIVRMVVDGDLLEVEVEDKLTTDQWRGEFDSAFIEDLTHKTGNFKQFSIFCSMLESALTQSSESVTLDLLTYTDLELLRNRKVGVATRHAPGPKSSTLNSKRYLILIYSVEFDRIHYPLPLPYMGKPDPVALQKVIRSLKEELSMLKSVHGKDFRDIEIRRLRAELARVVEEKQDAEALLLHLQEEAKLLGKGGALKEVRILKKIVQTLEEELAKERTKHQRSSSKRNLEYRQLADELEEVKASERNLRVRVKSLTNELAMYKRGKVTPVGPSPQSRSGSGLSGVHGSHVRNGFPVKSKDIRRSTSQERSTSRERGGHWSAASREGRSGSLTRVPRLTPSPSGTRLPRFDPTAYIKDKERKQKESESKHIRRTQREIRSSPVSDRGRLPSRGSRGARGDSAGKNRGRSSSVESMRCRQTSASSMSELEDFSEPLPLSAGRRRVKRTRKPLTSSSWNGMNVEPRDKTGSRKQLASTPTKGRRTGKENVFDPSTDLSEIDARLQALQEYMKNLDTRT